MTTEKELHDVVKERLLTEGYLRRLQGEVRGRVIALLREPGQTPPTPPKVHDTLNLLIREYLDWMAYTYSKTVFEAESGVASENASHEDLTQRLGVNEDETTKGLPLLLSIVTSIQNHAV